MDSFKLSTGCMVVVATDVAARGLDLSSITTVVHYDAVRNIDTFVHRSGRTAVSAKPAEVIPVFDEEEYIVSFFRISF